MAASSSLQSSPWDISEKARVGDNNDKLILTQEQIETFLKEGVLVVDNMLTSDQVQAALEGMSRTLAHQARVDTTNLPETGHGLVKLSSTNGSGGVLDCFYEDWKLEIATNPRLFHASTQLWEAAYCYQGESRQEILDCKPEEFFKWHPYGQFDCQKGYCYIDRIGYRLPTELATKLGAELLQHTSTAFDNPSATTKKKKKKNMAIQRSLTPHLDCCPETFYSTTQDEKSKWRPIQCFVSLTDAMEPNMGGFEAARGFHRNFHQWKDTRPPTVQIIQKKQQIGGKLVMTQQQVAMPAPCVGEYTHIRPVEDSDVMKQVQHVPVRAGSAVFFDNRIPHANAYRHDGTIPRCVVYCSFLPDVAINRNYVAKQLAKWKGGEPPNDQWIRADDGDPKVRGRGDQRNDEETILDAPWLNPFSRKLMGIDSW